MDINFGKYAKYHIFKRRIYKRVCTTAPHTTENPTNLGYEIDGFTNRMP